MAPPIEIICSHMARIVSHRVILRCDKIAAMKLVLTVQGGSLHGRQFELEQGYITMGRHENCALRFHHVQDPGVSNYHVLIESNGHGYVLKDQQSTNGTFINGRQIHEDTQLYNGDQIRLGRDGPEIRVTLVAPQEQIATVPPPPPAPAKEKLSQTIT